MAKAAPKLIPRSESRNLAFIEADPKATHKEIKTLAIESPIAALQHPNCPEKLWWDLAAKHPTEALDSPAGVVFLRASADKWTALEQESVARWINETADHLPEAVQHLFAADCAEHVLPLYEAVFPNDNRPREGIRVRRLLARGRATETMWTAARTAAKEAVIADNQEPTKNAAWDAARAAAGETTAASALAAAWAAGWAATDAAGGDEARSAAWTVERLWQWRCLLQYARIDAPAPVVGKKASAVVKSLRSIKADPGATAVQIQLLAQDRPLEALAHINCPLELWWTLAAQYPFDAMDSPTYLLMLSLSTPGRWAQLERDNIYSWIVKFTHELSERDKRLFAVDCTEHVLPLFEEKNPRDDRPRRSMEAARLVAKRRPTPTEIAESDSAAYAAAWDASNKGAAYAASYAAAASTTEAIDAAYAAERVWQWHWLIDYLRAHPTVALATETEVRREIGEDEDEMMVMVTERPLEALAHPDCPPEIWWDLAATYPLEAMASLSSGNYLMEDPSQWANLEKANIESWIDATLERIPAEATQVFIADCADRVLPAFERLHPKDKRPREAIKIRRLFAKGEATESVWNKAQVAAETAAESVEKSAAWASAKAIASLNASEAAQYAANAAAQAATGSDGTDSAARAAARAAERRWQWERLVRYVKGVRHPKEDLPEAPKKIEEPKRHEIKSSPGPKPPRVKMFDFLK